MAEQKTTGQLADEARLRREQIELEAAELRLEDTRQASEERKAQNAYRLRQRTLRQNQALNQARSAQKLSKVCSHRQGGQNGDMFKGKGPTALKVEKMPDGFTVRIRCLCCPLRVTSPIPSDASKKLKRGEAQEERTTRLEKFAADKARFDKYYAISQEDALTGEAGAPMECGTTFKVTDDDGNQIYKPRPSDSYAIEVVAA
jgi:hypothetical protein